MSSNDKKPAPAAMNRPAAKAPAAPVAPVAPVAPLAPPVPAWDKATWMSMANIKLGVPVPVVAAALHAEPSHVMHTEAEVRALVKKITEQSL